MNIRPSYDEFVAMAETGNLLPVWTDLPAGGETPISCYEKLNAPPFSFLIEDLDTGGKTVGCSVIGWRPFLKAVIRDARVEVLRGGEMEVLQHASDPLLPLRGLMRDIRMVVPPDLPVFHAGLVGYINYDLVRKWERLPEITAREKDLPEGILLAPSRFILCNRDGERISVVVLACVEGEGLRALYERSCKDLEETVAQLKRPHLGPSPSFSVSTFRSDFLKDAFEDAVLKAKEYIGKGDAFQVVLSQCFSGECEGDSFSLYKGLRKVNPSPYMFYLNCEEVKLIGASPETLVSLHDGKITLRPIAGTRPRGKGPGEDRALEKELLNDPKERAEHIMLVDLGRNDVGRVAAPGSVQVSRFMEVERYSHVMHIVSQIEGDVRPGLDGFDVFRATFPAGTVTGAPKIRAMEIIQELESSQRGPYAGAVGCFGFDGDIEFCITIRTIVLENNRISVRVGAGIVHDSSPEKEYEETLNKAAAMFEVIRGVMRDAACYR